MNQRFHSLDVFRGATVALMILVNNPGSWSHIYTPLDHAEWHGCTPTDLVFPFFLFAVGNAMAFVLPRLEEQHIFWQKLIRRTLLIFLIGLFLSWFPFIKWQNDSLVMKPWAFIDDKGNPDGVRILGVLQRIAICYFMAGIIIHFFKLRGAFVAAATLLLVYWFLCIAGNPADPYSMTGYFGRDIDIAVLGKSHMLHLDKVNGVMYHFDYEGLTSSLAAIAQVIFGYMVGHYIITRGKTAEMLNALFVAGAVMTVCGLAWGMFFPINKKIWSSSYAVFTTGLAITVLSVLIYLIEFKNIRGWWTRFFDVFGKNALFIFVLSGLLPRAMGLIRISDGLTIENKPKYLTPFSWFYQKICAPLFSEPKMGSLFYALCFIAMMWFLAWLLDRKKIYIKV